MQLVLNRYATSVNELSLKLDKQGWSKLIGLVEGLQEEGECLELDISSKEEFILSLENNEDLIAALFERMIEDGVGEEHRYVDPTNESYGIAVEK
jgi:hypothetical protein